MPYVSAVALFAAAAVQPFFSFLSIYHPFCHDAYAELWLYFLTIPVIVCAFKIFTKNIIALALPAMRVARPRDCT